MAGRVGNAVLTSVHTQCADLRHRSQPAEDMHVVFTARIGLFLAPHLQERESRGCMQHSQTMDVCLDESAFYSRLAEQFRERGRILCALAATLRAQQAPSVLVRAAYRAGSERRAHANMLEVFLVSAREPVRAAGRALRVVGTAASNALAVAYESLGVGSVQDVHLALVTAIASARAHDARARTTFGIISAEVASHNAESRRIERWLEGRVSESEWTTVDDAKRATLLAIMREPERAGVLRGVRDDVLVDLGLPRGERAIAVARTVSGLVSACAVSRERKLAS